MMPQSKIAIVAVLLLVLITASILALSLWPRYTKYTDSFFDTFDTAIIVVAYTRNKQEFNAYFQKIHERFQELHRLYDIYNSYEGINNIKTINDNAGVAPVKVEKEIIDLILFAKEWYARTGGTTNIAMGSVLRIWHDFRERGEDDPEHAKLPNMHDLQEAARHTDLDMVIVDTQNSTVFLADKNMSLDVGAVAKGFATELVAREMAAAGLKSCMISASGNIRSIGNPLDRTRKLWSVGIQDPQKSIFSDDNLIDIVYIGGGVAVATSGGYQRRYVVDDKVYHHLIDPVTLMPANYYSSVTVLTNDAGVADFMSTTLFLLPYDKSRALAESLSGVEALWVLPDGSVEATDGMKAVMKSHGASGN